MADYPIVLAHGIARFDALRQWFVDQARPFGVELSDSTHYFRNIGSHLEANGFAVHHAKVSFAAGIETRARELAAEIEGVIKTKPAAKVHLIAHSMGGLDARHMLVDVSGAADKVASLTTIGTPHFGSSWADVALGFGGEHLVDAARKVIDLDGFRDLTTEACSAFNARAIESEVHNRVLYQACASTQERSATFLPLQPAWMVIKAKEGANDGLVSEQSQLWQAELITKDGSRKQVRQLRFPFAADHLSQIGWWTPNLLKSKSDLTNLRTQIAAFERGVRDFYLGLAVGLNTDIGVENH